MILETAESHFAEDIKRAEALLTLARRRNVTGSLQDDVLRSSWMIGVGAVDAFFADAFADLIARTLQAKEREKKVKIPDRLSNMELPVVALLEDTKGGWRWRLAARAKIEKENVLSLGKIRTLFNQFFPKSHGILSKSDMERWILHRDSQVRMVDVTSTAYRAATGSQKTGYQSNASEKLAKRMEEIFQRRHDCIHNCDRPKIAVQQITELHVEKVLKDVEFLVSRCSEDLRREFPKYLTRLGFSAVARNAVGC
jgi:hypothetical protein